jgi:hypothetical protein
MLDFTDVLHAMPDVVISGGDDPASSCGSLVQDMTDDQCFALLQSKHDMGHFSACNVVSQLKALCIGMTTMAEKVVGTCKLCAQYNPGWQKFHLQSSVEAILPMEHVCTDLTAWLGTTVDGFNMALVMVCVFSQFVIL